MKKRVVKKRFPDPFWQAWKKEFHVPTETEYLASLIHCSRPDSEIPAHMAEKARQKLKEWIESELNSDGAATTFSRLRKAERYNNRFERYPRLRTVALLSYFALVLAKQKRITNDLFWEVIGRRYRQKGLTPPSDTSRKRMLRELGLELPGTPAGRPRKKGPSRDHQMALF